MAASNGSATSVCYSSTELTVAEELSMKLDGFVNNPYVNDHLQFLIGIGDGVTFGQLASIRDNSNVASQRWFYNAANGAGAAIGMLLGTELAAEANVAAQSAYVTTRTLVGPYGPVFGRYGNGLLNDNNYFRVGWGWDGTKEVFRIAFGNKSAPIHWHVDLW